MPETEMTKNGRRILVLHFWQSLVSVCPAMADEQDISSSWVGASGPLEVHSGLSQWGPAKKKSRGVW